MSDKTPKDLSHVKPIPYDNDDYDDEAEHAPLSDKARDIAQQQSNDPIGALIGDVLDLDPDLPPPLEDKKKHD